MSWFDLHMHSLYSDDGEFTPTQLMALCQKQGVTTAAIADHNSTRGIKEGQAAAEKLGINIIPAAEMDCTFRQYSLHILGYGIDPDNPCFHEIEKDIVDQEQAASRKRIHLVQELGIVLDEDKIYQMTSNGVVTGELIAEVALAEPANRSHSLLAPYFPNGSRSDNPFVNFYWDLCAPGKPAYAHINFLPLTEIVKLITDSGGFPILAHPGNNIGMNKEVFMGIIQTGVQGVEAYSSYHTPEITEFYAALAAEHDLLVTVGSDFHGKTKPAIQLGSVSCGGQDQQIYQQFMRRLEKH